MEPDFENLLVSNAAAYDSEIGDWWHQRTQDLAHTEAYQIIASRIVSQWEAHSPTPPQTVCDYACGNGVLLELLLKHWPNTQFIGLDGSRSLLENSVNSNKAQNGHSYMNLVEAPELFDSLTSGTISLCPTHLPTFQFESNSVDLLIHCFPNIVPDDKYLYEFNDNGYGNIEDNEIARMLARFREMDPEDETSPPLPKEDMFDELMTHRVIARNFRQLLKPQGLLTKVEYTNCERHELSDLTQLRSAFMEGALGQKIKGEECEVFFKEINSSYHPSEVILDVYAQTQDPGDKEGGFNICFMEAL